MHAKYAPIIECLLQQCDCAALSGPETAPGAQNGLFAFLDKILGCGWLPRQFDSAAPAETIPPSKLVCKSHETPEGLCAACQRVWPKADRLCGELVSQGEKMRLEWHEVGPLVDLLAQRIKAIQFRRNDIRHAQGYAYFIQAHETQLIDFYLTRQVHLEDAQDLAQEAILKLWQNRRKSIPPHVAFLFGIARRLYAEFLRKQKIARLTLQGYPNNEPIGADKPCCDSETKFSTLPFGIREELGPLIKTLSPNQQKVIYLRFVRGCSHRQTAAKLGLSLRSVQTHELRAIDKLRGLVDRG
jgi:RNA polymerase sigma factor (sigma-70 family)